KANTDTISLTINGFSDKQVTYAKQSLALLAKPELNKAQFALLKAQYEREINNFRLRPPHQQAFSLTSGVLDPYGATYKEKKKLLETINVNDLSDFINDFS